MQKSGILIVALACLFLGGCSAAIYSTSDLKNLSAGETKTQIMDLFSCGHG